MPSNGILAKIIRGFAVVCLGITAIFTLMGGAGTTCAALDPTNPQWADSMGALAQAQWLYILFVIVTIAIGVMGVAAVVQWVRAMPGAYRLSLITLVAGIVVGGIHMAVSRSLRGKSMPVDMVVYITLLTLIFFLILRIPKIWQALGLENPTNPRGNSRSGMAAILFLACGLLTLTVQYWAGPTHIFGSGFNYADAWHTQLSILGWGLNLASAAALFIPRWQRVRRSNQPITCKDIYTPSVEI